MAFIVVSCCMRDLHVMVSFMLVDFKVDMILLTFYFLVRIE